MARIAPDYGVILFKDGLADGNDTGSELEHEFLTDFLLEGLIIAPMNGSTRAALTSRGFLTSMELRVNDKPVTLGTVLVGNMDTRQNMLPFQRLFLAGETINPIITNNEGATIDVQVLLVGRTVPETPGKTTNPHPGFKFIGFVNDDVTNGSDTGTSNQLTLPEDFHCEKLMVAVMNSSTRAAVTSRGYLSKLEFLYQGKPIHDGEWYVGNMDSPNKAIKIGARFAKGSKINPKLYNNEGATVDYYTLLISR